MHSRRMTSDERQFYEYARAIGMPAMASGRDEIDKLFSKLIEAIDRRSNMKKEEANTPDHLIEKDTRMHRNEKFLVLLWKN